MSGFVFPAPSFKTHIHPRDQLSAFVRIISRGNLSLSGFVARPLREVLYLEVRLERREVEGSVYLCKVKGKETGV